MVFLHEPAKKLCKKAQILLVPTLHCFSTSLYATAAKIAVNLCSIHRFFKCGGAADHYFSMRFTSGNLDGYKSQKTRRPNCLLDDVIELL